MLALFLYVFGKILIHMGSVTRHALAGAQHLSDSLEWVMICTPTVWSMVHNTVVEQMQFHD